nr:MAG TPA: hypothetical protein [Caudoviricetes sp.]
MRLSGISCEMCFAEGQQHIREKKCFVLKLFLRAVRGLATEKGENFPLLNLF